MALIADQQTLGVVSRRPAIAIASALILGILLHPFIAPHPFGFLITLSLLAIAAACSVSKSYFCSTFLLAGIVLSGIAIAQREHFQFSSSDISLFASDEPRLAGVEVRLNDEPRMLQSSLAFSRHTAPRQFVSTQVLRVKTWGGWIGASGSLPVMMNTPSEHLHVGQIVRVFGMLERPSAAQNPGQFDWANYYRQQRIAATLTATRAANVSVVDRPALSPLAWLQAKSRELLAAGFRADHEIDRALLSAILLGDRDPELRSVQDEFKKTGVAYQLSVSGLHIAMLGGFVLLLCRLALLRPRASLVIAEAFVLLYAAVALPSHSGVRSVILCTAIFLAKWTHRSTNRFQLLAICVAAMLLYHPLDLYSFGFQLSFAAVVGLALFFPAWRGFVMVLQDQHMMLAPLRRTWRNVVTERIRDIAYMTIIVWVCVLPLILYNIGRVNLWAIAGSIVVFPIVLIALLAGLFKIVLTLLWSSAAPLWATLAGVPIIVLRHMVDLLNGLPGLRFVIPAPSIGLIVAYYILLLIPLIRPMQVIAGRRRPWLRLAPIAGVVAILFLPAFPRVIHPAAPSGQMRVTLLALGAGQCAVIEPPGGEPILFDAGSSSVSDLTEKIVAPFLRTEGQRQIDEIVLSHGDYDHISAAGEIAGEYSVRDIVISPHFRRNAQGNWPDQQLLETVDRLHIPLRITQMPDHVDLSGGGKVDVLWPPSDGQWNSNNAGLVLRLTYAGRTILFPADIQDPALEGLLKHPKWLKSDILIAPHHGSSESLTPAFLRAVSPDAILSSNAWRLTSKQKRFDREAEKIPLYRTSDCGAITVVISQDGAITLSTFSKGRQDIRLPAPLAP